MNAGPQSALAALESARDALVELDARCCDPGRSPRLAELSDRLTALRDRLLASSGDGVVGVDVDATRRELEELGARVGALQVGCCAPNRLPLYGRMLEQLTVVQLTLDD